MKENIKGKVAVMMAVVAVACLGDTCTDEELRQDVQEFLTTRVCGNYGKYILTDEIRFDGNTNRLANVLVEFAQTNDEWVASRAVRQLGEYGTAAQLPFLYSCATNPVVGDRAVKSILRIEGVTSNSVAAASSYFSVTNIPPRMTQQRDNVCICLVDAAWDDNVLSSVRAFALDAAYDFAANANQCHKWLDEAIMRHDASYRYSRRRLAVFRAAYLRGINQYSYSYVTNAINELVAYPEANLPD